MNDKFIKYNSLTNHYQQKDITYMTGIHIKKMNEVNWVANEKIDGSNISFLFQLKEDPMWFSRNNVITGTNFQGGKEVIEETLDKLKMIQDFVNRTNRSVRLYGELFGKGIQNRIYYGSGKYIKFFDMMQDDMMISQKHFENYFYDNGLGYLTTPKFGTFSTLEEALEIDLEFNSLLSDKEDNTAEGVVIKPWKEPLFTGNGSIFYIKKKHPKYVENEQKERRPKPTFSDEVNEIQHKFAEKVNENRLKSVFSKEEEISSHKQIGTYLGFVKKDIMEEMNQDGFDKKDYSKNEYIFITGSTDAEIVGLIKGFL